MFPKQVLLFLGLLVDLVTGSFVVPADKLAVILTQLDAAISDPAGLSYRELLSIAGRLMATRLAVQIAPLMAGSIYKGIISGQDDLLAPLVNPETAVLILSHIRDTYFKYNGRAFWRPPTGVVLVGDASDIGGGAFVATGELETPFLLSFTPAQIQACQSHEFHSTSREST